VQVEAILNMRLRSLRKLEEIEIRKEDKTLRLEKKNLQLMIANDANLMKKISSDIEELKVRFGASYGGGIGKRLTKIDTKAEATEYDERDFIVKEPTTVVLSEKGWVKVMKGHIAAADIGANGFKDGDNLRTVVQCQSTDKIIIFSDNGKCFNKNVSDLPSGRGYGEPISLMVEMGDAMVIDILAYSDDMKNLFVVLASKKGFGFKCKMETLLSSTKNGKVLMNLTDGDKMVVASVASAGLDVVSITSTAKMLLCFPLSEIPEMTKGKGVVLQKYADGKTRLKKLELVSKKSGLKISKRAGVGKIL
jgi:topoisomerase-4 subunit A